MRISHIIATTAFISLVSAVSFADIEEGGSTVLSADEVSKSLVCKVNGIELMAKTANDCKAAGGEMVKDKK
jgi:hypothetical protein